MGCLRWGLPGLAARRLRMYSSFANPYVHSVALNGDEAPDDAKVDHIIPVCRLPIVSDPKES